MNTLTARFEELKKKNRLGLMTHVVAGYPSLSQSEKLVREMDRAGVDIIEIQIPFSDPIADGPVIMEANEVALRNGTTLKDCFALVQKLSKTVSAPLFLMGYYNSVHHVGVDAFCRRAKASGAAGLIIPDLPVDEESYEHLDIACRKYGLHHIRVVSPTSTDERLQLNAAHASGFVYCTARIGITGADGKMDARIASHIQRIRRAIHLPVAVGFGIATPADLQMLRGHADIAVIGSAVISRIRIGGVSGAVALVKRLARETSV